MNKQAQSWYDWLETEEGKKCLDGKISGTYLKNRLWYAYMAGYEAANKSTNK